MRKNITGGLYLVIDPYTGEGIIPRVEAALKGGVTVLQIWNHWHSGQDEFAFISQVCSLAHEYNVPVLIHEKWEWLLTTNLDGVHFDHIPFKLPMILDRIKRPVYTGITCGNDMEKILWAIQHKINYLSFCSMFPSTSASVCELVDPSIIRYTRQLTSIPIFAAGGITPENISAVLKLGVNGIATISGILNTRDPEAAAKKYRQNLIKHLVL